MLCGEFKCIDEIDNACQVDVDSGGCIGNLCESWGECTNCQQLDQEACWAIEDEFLYGDRVLAAPVLEAGQKQKRLYLPGKNTAWKNAFTTQGLTNKSETDYFKSKTKLQIGSFIQEMLK